MNTTARILIVEDKENEREALARLLRMEGYEVVVAEHPKEAIQYLDEPFDLVISDLKMGKTSGVTCCVIGRTVTLTRRSS